MEYVPILGTIPGWITALASGGGFVAWLKYLNDRRKIQGDRLTDLEDENRQLRSDFDAYRKQCIEENDAMRQRIDGLTRQLLHLEKRAIEELGAFVPPATRRRFGIKE